MKKILIGLIAISSIAMGADEISTPQTSSPTAKGTFSNRFGLSFANSGKETWDKDKYNLSDNDVFERGYVINYKLLYNATDRFRIGGELAYDNSKLSDYVKKIAFGDSSIQELMLGLAVEYDIYQGTDLSVYLTGIGGVVTGGLEITTKDDKGRTLNKEKFDASLYAKFGLGLRLNNGIGIEAGSKATSYKYSSENAIFKYKDTLYRQQFYAELNFTF